MEIKSISDMDFDALYEMYAEQVYQIALHYSGNHHVAEEITQTVFMEICDYEGNVCLENVEAWLCTLARNQAVDYVRKVKREYLVENVFDEMDNFVHIESFDSMHGSDSMDDYFIVGLMKEDRFRFLEKIYDDLYEKKPLWYFAITGAYILGVPQKIIAEKLGMSVGSLEMLLVRIKKWIRKRYQKEFDRLDKK